MTITENLQALGSWSIQLSDDTPVTVLQQLAPFGHIAVFRGQVDVSAPSDATLLRGARYVGVLRDGIYGRNPSGSAMLFWLGDEDHKGKVIEAKLVLTNQTLSQCLTAVLPPAVTLGTIHDPGGTYTGTHQWQTPRDALDVITTAFGVEYRVNGDGTLDVGTAAQLYNTTAPTATLSATGTGQDLDVQSLGATFDPDLSAIDYTTRLVLLGQSTDAAGTSTPFAEATVNAPSVPYLDIHGNPVVQTRMVSDSAQTSSSVTAAAQLQLNQFNRLKQVLTVTAEDYDTEGNFVVGDSAWVFDPDNGITDATKEITFLGEVIHPAIVRISGLTWPVTYGHTVAFRTQAGVWIDLTPWVVWESGTTQVTVGDLPKTLTSGSNPVAGRQDGAPDSSIPNAPSGLSLSTTSVLDARGNATATLTASWTGPTRNTDGSVLQDLSHYLVQYRWHGRAPLWDTRITADTTVDIPGLGNGLSYDVQVSAVDLAGNTSAPTAVSSIITVADAIAPNPPSDPVVGSYLGQLKITWDGKDNTGAAMPSDFAIVEVHVSATSGFTPVAGPGSTTLVAQMSAAGAAYSSAPYGATRYVKLVAVDNSFNRSAPSNQASGATTQVADGDIAALSVGKLTAGTMSADVVIGGRFATALTGARVEVNSLGFQKFASDGVTKLISLTGTEALLTGTFKTALSGRRIEMGAGGATGEIDFYAPDGTLTLLRAFTEGNGVESIQFGVPIAANAGASKDLLWNRWHANSDEWAQMRSNKVDFEFGTHRPDAPGFFTVRMSSDRGATTNGSRFTIDANGEYFWDAAGVARYTLQDDRVQWYFASGGSGGAVGFFAQTAGVQFSPILQMVVGIGYALSLRVINDSAYGGQLMEVEQWTQSSYAPIRASAFVVSSDEAGKTEIADYDGDALAEITATKVRSYRRRNFTGDRMKPAREVRGHDGTKRLVHSNEIAERGRPGPVEIGLIAQEAPTTITGGNKHVDTYQYAAWLHRGIQQLAQRVADLERSDR